MKYPVAREITTCRLCGSGRFTSVLDFGNPYISDFLEPSQEGTRAPLHVVRCEDCGLIQTLHTIDQQLLWGGRYWYKSGVNESMVRALSEIAIQAGSLKPGDRVLDIGANDGTLLRFYPDFVYKVAIDPIASFKGELGQAADVVVRDFWPTEIDGQFQRITSIACFYDVDDPHAFVQAIKEALAPGGLWIVQMQDEESILRDTAFDYFCHEHCCLYSLTTFSQLCIQHGLRVITWQANAVNGGSLRFVVGHDKTTHWSWQPNENGQRWVEFRLRSENMREAGMEGMHDFVMDRAPVFGLAASTKANTVLQWYGLDNAMLPFIVERAPEKIGRITVGSRIPIISEEEAAEWRPGGYVALAWHLLDGLRKRHPETPFLTLLPEVKTYEALVTAIAR